jgi:hypothetical protein
MVNVALVFLRRRVNCLIYLLHPDMTPGTVSSSGNCQLSATTPHRLSYSRCWSCWSCACRDCGVRRGHILVRPTPSSLYLVPLPGIRVLLRIFSSSHIISHPTQTHYRMVHSVFHGEWSMRKLSATVVDDVFPDVIFWSLVALCTCISFVAYVSLLTHAQLLCCFKKMDMCLFCFLHPFSPPPSAPFLVSPSLS